MNHLAKNLVIVACLIALGAFGTWVIVRPRLPRGEGFTDGEQFLSATRTREELRLARWETPQLVAALSAEGSASEPSVEPGGGRVFFARGAVGSEDLWVATPERDGFSVRPLAEINSPDRETAPFLHEGWLWFASDRAGGEGGLDLWRAPLAGERFLAAENAGPSLNTAADETDPALRAAAGGAVELWFASNREVSGTGDFDLLSSRTDGVRFAAPQLAEAVHTPFDERAPAFTPDGRVLMFASDRPGGAGGFDLWRSLEKAGELQPPLNLGAPNGAGDESGPTLADDGFTLLFAADRAGAGRFEVLRTRTRELFPVEGPRFTLTDFTVLLLLALVALLAWLARRWEALDVLYKCILASLVIHLLFLWYAKRVDVEADARDLGLGGDTFEIQVLGDLLAEIAKLEDRAFGEDVEIEQVQAAPSAAPRATTPSPVREIPAAEAAALERVDASAPPVSDPAARERALARSAVVDAVSDPVRTESEPYERIAGDAPELAVESLAAPSLAASSTTVDAPAPDFEPERREPLPERVAKEAAGRRAARPASSTLDAEAAAARARPSREILPVTPARSADAGPAVAIAQPSDRIEREAGTAGSEEPARQPAVEPARLADAGAAIATEGTNPSRAPLELPALEQGTRPAPGDPLPDVSPARSEEATAELARRPRDRALEPARSERPAEAPVAMARPGDVVETASDEAEASGSTALALAPATTKDAPAQASAAPIRPALRASDGVREAGVAASPDAPAAERAAEVAPRQAPSRAPVEPRALARTESALPSIPLPAPGDRADGAAPPGATPAAASLPALAIAPAITPGGRSRLPPAPTTRGPSRASLLAGGAVPEPEPAREGAIAAPAERERIARPLTSAPPSISTSARLYERRFGDAREVALREGGGSEETERAVLAGLRYLARVQRPQGHFGDARDVDANSKYRDVRVGKTALATLAFLGAGHTHRSEGEFSANVERALLWLVSRQEADSGHFGNSESYSHGIATYALAECYAMTADPALRPALDKALAHVLAMQQLGTGDARKDGGWTYYYPEGPGFDAFPRASISAWQVMAIESAKVGGIAVPDQPLEAARLYFLRSFDPSFGGFRYTHSPSWLQNSYGTLPASTPASMFALTLLGEGNHSRVHAAEEFVTQRLPEGYRYRGEDAFVRSGQCNLYFWYYSTLALFCRGGPAWREWNDALKETLLPAQQRDGSWDAIDLYAQRYASDDPAEKSYSTAMCVLMLEVYYRYFTPLLGRMEHR